MAADVILRLTWLFLSFPLAGSGSWSIATVPSSSLLGRETVHDGELLHYLPLHAHRTLIDLDMDSFGLHGSSGGDEAITTLEWGKLRDGFDELTADMKQIAEATKRMAQTLQSGDMKETADHPNRIISLECHQLEPSNILSGDWDNIAQIWNTRRGHSVRSLWNCCVNGDGIDFNADGQEILTASWRTEDALQIWDFGTGNLVETIEWNAATPNSSCMLFAAQFSKDAASSMIMAGGSQENEVKFFHRTAPKETSAFGALIQLPKPVFTVDFGPSSRLAAVGSADGLIRVLDVV